MKKPSSKQTTPTRSWNLTKTYRTYTKAKSTTQLSTWTYRVTAKWMRPAKNVFPCRHKGKETGAKKSNDKTGLSDTRSNQTQHLLLKLVHISNWIVYPNLRCLIGSYMVRSYFWTRPPAPTWRTRRTPLHSWSTPGKTQSLPQPPRNQAFPKLHWATVRSALWAGCRNGKKGLQAQFSSTSKWSNLHVHKFGVHSRPPWFD